MSDDSQSQHLISKNLNENNLEYVKFWLITSKRKINHLLLTTPIMFVKHRTTWGNFWPYITSIIDNNQNYQDLNEFEKLEKILDREKFDQTYCITNNNDQLSLQSKEQFEHISQIYQCKTDYGPQFS